MSISALAFAVMGVFVKLLSRGIHQFELVFFRTFINFILVLIPMLVLRQPLWNRQHGRLLVFRGLAGFCGLCCLFYTLEHLPLSVAMLLQWSSPIFVILFSRLLLSERLPPGSTIGIGAAFTGILLLLEPGSAGLTLPLFPLSIGALGAAAAALAYVAVRTATARVGPNMIVLYFSMVSAILSAPLAVHSFVVPTLRQGAELLAMGVAGSIAQLTMTQAYRFAPAGIASTMSLLGAAISALLGWLLFSENFAALQWTGMLLLGASITWIGLRSELHRRRSVSKV